jgi:hypothetical protein
LGWKQEKKQNRRRSSKKPTKRQNSEPRVEYSEPTTKSRRRGRLCHLLRRFRERLRLHRFQERPCLRRFRKRRKLARTNRKALQRLSVPSNRAKPRWLRSQTQADMLPANEGKTAFRTKT